MKDQNQTPIGGSVSVAAGSVEEYAYKSDGGEYINLVEMEASADGVNASVRIKPGGQGKTVNIPRLANDGAQKASQNLTTGDVEHPIPVSTVVGETRYPMLRKMKPDDRVVFEFENTTTAAVDVRFRAAAASTLEAAGAGGD